MIVNIQKLNKRLFSFVLAFFVALGCFVPIVVSAKWGEPLNYQDLDYTVRYGSEFNEVSFELPVSNYQFTWDTYYGDKHSVYGQDSISFSLTDGTYYDYASISAYPVSSIGLDLSSIPAGTTLYLDLKFDIDDSNGKYPYDTGNVYQYYYYLNYAGDWVKYGYTELEFEFGKTFTLAFEIEDIPNSFAFVPYVAFSDLTSLVDSARYTFSIEHAHMEMEISSAYWEQFQNEQNGKAIEEIGNKVDDLINGTPEQNEQVQGAVDDMNNSGDKLGDLGDSMANIEKPDMSDVKVNINELVPPTSLTALVTPIKNIWQNQTITAMLTIVATLVLVSWVFFGKKGG